MSTSNELEEGTQGSASVVKELKDKLVTVNQELESVRQDLTGQLEGAR